MTKKKRQLKKAFKRMLRAQESVILGKLMHNEDKYGFGWDWRDEDWQEKLWRDLPHHVTKGDPRDVAIYAAFCIYHSWRTAPPGHPYLNHQGQPRAVDPNLKPAPAPYCNGQCGICSCQSVPSPQPATATPSK